MDISTPINIVHSYHAKERQLFARMVFALGIDPSCSMLIIAFWLWLEENGHADIIRRISSFNNDVVQAIATVGQNFVESLHLNPSPNPNQHPVDSNSNDHFRQAAIHGITYYLHNVCLKAFDDIRAKVEEQAQNRQVEDLVQQMRQAYIGRMNVSRAAPNSHRLGLLQGCNTSLNPLRGNILNLQGAYSIGEQNCSSLARTTPIQPFVPQGEGTSRDASKRTPNMMEVAHALESIYPLRGLLTMGMSQPLSRVDLPLPSNADIASAEAPPIRRDIPNDHLTVGGNTLSQNSMMRSGINPDIYLHPLALPQPLPRCDVPRDERTLFVTFSNGYPLTEEDLYEFFMRHYGDVELITVEKPTAGRAPLFAHVSFYTLETVLRVLEGNRRVKFMTKGRHLWARRFIPKRLQNQLLSLS